MDPKHFIVMGAGEVGCHLARTLSSKGHAVTLIDIDAGKRAMVEEQLDVGFVLGNGTHVPVLEAARVDRCELFVAASSSDEANLAASLLAKRAGAARTVVRVATYEDVTTYGNIYEQVFQADLLLSTQLLTTTRILNAVVGYNTLETEYLAHGALQIRRIRVERGSILHERRLAEAGLPKDCLVLAFLSSSGLVVPTGDDHAAPGDDALVLATTEAIDAVERRISRHSQKLELVVIAGGGATSRAVAPALIREARSVQIIEIDRARAEVLAAEFPDCEIIHGDATDTSTLAAQGVGDAAAFLALTGNDQTNLMACLLGQELGVERLIALVQKSETSTLWQRVGLMDVVSPRAIAAERIGQYIESDYEPHIVSFENGAAQFVQRHVESQSAVAGGLLADVEIPQGLIVAAVLRNGRAIIPRGDFRLEVGDDVIIFVRREEVSLVHLLFPGGAADSGAL